MGHMQVALQMHGSMRCWCVSVKEIRSLDARADVLVVIRMDGPNGEETSMATRDAAACGQWIPILQTSTRRTCSLGPS